MPRIFNLPGTDIKADIGRFARQSDGSVWLTCGDNVVLSTAVGTSGAENNLGFFPLTVECRRRPSSVGKFPGGFIKREGRLNDAEILLSRLIDRSVRPLFPKFYMQEVQLITTLLSYNGDFPVQILGILASSLSLTLSGIPFKGPVGAVIFTRDKDGEWKLNPDHTTVENADDVVLIVGTATGICMVEASCNFAANDQIIELMDKATPVIQDQVKWQQDIKSELGIVDREYNEDKYSEWKEKIAQAMPEDKEKYFFAQEKSVLSSQMSDLKAQIKAKFAANVEAGELSENELDMFYSAYLKEELPALFYEKNQRFDMREFSQIRQIECLTDVLPCTHGSSMFTRGQTQALATITLGTGQDAQKIETLMHGTEDKTFMLHYNFPPFATGEVKPIRGVGRREVGHGYLAEKAFTHVLPDKEKFPYTIRSIVDLLESNGSSSMATVCATSLALMDAGVPLKQGIAGIAMGLLRDKNGHFMPLSDITGTEDAYGIMDLKVAGDKDGITAIQMDIKSDSGIPKDVIAKTLELARQGREHILGKMNECLSSAKNELKSHAPQVNTLKIPQDKIGAVIGPGGKNIKAIVEETGAQVDIADDGIVSIFAQDRMSSRKAENWVRVYSGEVKVGSSFHGKVARIAEFGIFVTLVPGKDGLVHVSTIARNKKDKLESIVKPGDNLTVVVVACDPELGRISLAAPELEAE